MCVCVCARGRVFVRVRGGDAREQRCEGEVRDKTTLSDPSHVGVAIGGTRSMEALKCK